MLFPEIGLIFSPLTYGRLVPLHLNFHLYGWLSFPVLGLLFHWFYTSKRLAEAAMWIWSISLIIGGASWLAGYSSGKIFLEWTGVSASVLEFTFFSLWVVLTYSYLTKNCRARESWSLLLLKIPLLVLLGSLPFVFHYALNQKVYPAINPTSGGPTGASLLGSTLGLILIFGCLPGLLPKALKFHKSMFVFALLLITHLVVFSLMDHGHVTNLSQEQYLGLGSLLLWIPIIFWYYRKFDWPTGSRLWLISFAFWGSLLTISATFMFLPGKLEYVKFTSLLVAHSHLAMAGMLTAISMLILFLLGNQNSSQVTQHKYLIQNFYFYLWNMALAIHLGALIGLGYIENTSLASSFRNDFNSQAFDLLRIIAGLLMTYCSVYWFISSIKYAIKNKTNLTA